ncbi:MAG: PQQ-binding-like beta-propeller repeat protein [Planctomycetota bacterium]
MILKSSIHFVFCCVLPMAFAMGDDWRSIRGNDGLGRWMGSTVLSQSENVELKVRWKKQIGSGYSSVVVSDGKVITMATDGEQDRVICLSTQDGSEIWAFEMEPIFKGANGSFDGPLATPVIHQGIVYCLSARGKLFALNLCDGKQVWMRDLATEENAALPMYGFSTTPVVSGETLCVLAGAEKGALVGLNLKTGKSKWFAGSGPISSQIPMRMNINGQPTIVTGTGTAVIGVDPQNGELRFRFEHGDKNGSAMMPVPFDENKILLTNDDSFSKTFQIEKQDDILKGTEVWKERSIKNTYNVPVALDGHLYAYSTRILTCVDQQTGKAKWKSRQPGDGFLIGVDQHLVLSSKEGSMHIAKANPAAYEEIASTKVFDKLVWAIPAYADNAIYQRSFNEIACVDIVSNEQSMLASSTEALEFGTNFEAFMERVKSASAAKERETLISEYLETQTSFPILEDGIAHFVYRGKAEDVALACDAFGARQERAMQRLGDTSLFYYTMRLPADQRLSYIFLKDYQPICDPLNPRKLTSSMYAGEMEFAMRLPDQGPLEMSWFGMQDWKMPGWMKEDPSEKLKGTLVNQTIELDDKKDFEIAVYLPPSYSKGENRRYPTIYIPDGSLALSLGKLDQAYDQYFQANNKSEAIIVFLKTGPANPMAGPGTFLQDVAGQVVPFVDENYRSKAARENRAAHGFGFGGGMAFMLASSFSDKFGAAAVHSPLVFDDARAASINTFRQIEDSTKLYIDWGRFDMHNPVENWDIRDMAQTLWREVEANDSIHLRGGMVNDSTDWPSWRLRVGAVVQVLFDQ